MDGRSIYKSQGGQVSTSEFLFNFIFTSINKLTEQYNNNNNRERVKERIDHFLLSHGVVIFISFVDTGYVEDIVASNENLSEWTFVLFVDVFDRIAQLNVHVLIDTDQNTWNDTVGNPRDTGDRLPV